jgi:hypothetical protein
MLDHRAVVALTVGELGRAAVGVEDGNPDAKVEDFAGRGLALGEVHTVLLTIWARGARPKAASQRVMIRSTSSREVATE